MGRSRRARAWLFAATVLGLGHATISLLWTFGGTWLLGTVGGQLEEWGRGGGVGVRLALLVVVTAKVAAVALCWLAVLRGAGVERILAWLAGVILTAYGGVYTLVGLLAVNDLIAVPADADLTALRWHAYFWDPWFLLWGVCTLAALWLSRPRRDR